MTPDTSPHPFSWVSPLAQGRVLAVLAVLLLLLSVALARVGAPLRTEAAPLGILSYEFAGSGEEATRILRSWSADAREHAMLSLGLDFLYLFVYPSFIALACVLVARRARDSAPSLAEFGTRAAWGAVLAGALDAVENCALIYLLAVGPSDFPALLAWWCAALKFALVATGLFYVLAGLLALRFPLP